MLGGLAWALRDPGAFGIGGAGERFVIPYDAALDLTAEDRVVSVAGPGADLTLTVSVAPRPVRALAEEAFTLRFAGRDGADAPAIDDVEITFNMEMDMGRHLYRPVRSGDTWRAQVVLPVCTWGGERWFARIRFTSDGERRETVLLFDIPLGGGDGG